MLDALYEYLQELVLCADVPEEEMRRVYDEIEYYTNMEE